MYWILNLRSKLLHVVGLIHNYYVRHVPRSTPTRANTGSLGFSRVGPVHTGKRTIWQISDKQEVNLTQSTTLQEILEALDEFHGLQNQNRNTQDAFSFKIIYI